MDAAKALKALKEGDYRALTDALDWDEREDIMLPDGGMVTMARIGRTQLIVRPEAWGDPTVAEFNLMNHHDTEDETHDCHVRSVAWSRSQVAQAAEMAPILAAVSANVPDDPRELTG